MKNNEEGEGGDEDVELDDEIAMDVGNDGWTKDLQQGDGKGVEEEVNEEEHLGRWVHSQTGTPLGPKVEFTVIGYVFSRPIA